MAKLDKEKATEDLVDAIDKKQVAVNALMAFRQRFQGEEAVLMTRVSNAEDRVDAARRRLDAMATKRRK